MAWNFGGVSGDAASFLSRINWDDDNRKATLEGSFEVLPSSFYMGSFKLSNGVQAVMYTLADGKNAVGIVNRFNPTRGSISNPRFFALGAQSDLSVNTLSNLTIDTSVSPFTLQYSTFGDNLTYDFNFIPATAGTFRAEYWIGTDETGNKIFDEQRAVTQAEVDSGLPIAFTVGNPYILEQGSQLFVKFSGINFKGGAVVGGPFNGQTLPYFVSKILPYRQIQLNGHVEFVTTDINPVYIACDYEVDTSGTTSGLTLTVPLEFTDTFYVSDSSQSFTPAKPCRIDFTAFGQGTVYLQTSRDSYKFYYDGSQWRYKDTNSRNGGIV